MVTSIRNIEKAISGNGIKQPSDSELGEHPFPRSIKNIEALAIFRGATVGVKHAEAFQLIKFIDK